MTTTEKTAKTNIRFEFDIPRGEDKLRELVLYIAEKCESDPRFGKTKLNKILVFADFGAFAYCGKPITGVQYMRQPQGPVPRRMKPILDDLTLSKDIVIKARPVEGGFVEQRVINARKPNLDLFSKEELVFVDDMIRLCWGKTAAWVSEYSHGRAWKAAGESGGLIPYEAAFLSNEPITDYDQVRTEELAQQFGWSKAA